MLHTGLNVVRSQLLGRSEQDRDLAGATLTGRVEISPASFLPREYSEYSSPADPARLAARFSSP